MNTYKIKIIYPGMNSINYEVIADQCNYDETSFRFIKNGKVILYTPKALSIIWINPAEE
jgi:hypothetical protein